MTATREKQTLQLLADENLFVFSDNVTELVREASRDRRHVPRERVDWPAARSGRWR